MAENPEAERKSLFLQPCIKIATAGAGNFLSVLAAATIHMVNRKKLNGCFTAARALPAISIGDFFLAVSMKTVSTFFLLGQYFISVVCIDLFPLVRNLNLTFLVIRGFIGSHLVFVFRRILGLVRQFSLPMFIVISTSLVSKIGTMLFTISTVAGSLVLWVFIGHKNTVHQPTLPSITMTKPVMGGM